jgi:hypothetical protein
MTTSPQTNAFVLPRRAIFGALFLPLLLNAGTPAVAADRLEDRVKDAAERSNGEQVSSEQIAQSIADLSSPDYGLRERATLRLWRLGAVARPALLKAATGGDPEAAVRARSILERNRWGLTPQTPPETRRLIDQFRHGKVAVRQVLVSRLHDAGQDKLAVRLIGAVDDPDEQEQLVERWLDEASGGDFARGLHIPSFGRATNEDDGSSSTARALRSLIARRELDLVEDILRLRSGSPAKIRAYASFLLLTGRLGERLAKLEPAGSVDASRDGLTRMGLVYLHRAAGDLDAARQACRRQDNAASALAVALAIEAGAAKDLSDMALAAEKAAMPKHDEPFGATGWALPAQLGLAAWAHREAGREDPARRAITRIANTTTPDPSLAFRAAEALLVAGAPDETAELLLRHGDKLRAADLLIARAQFDKVLDLAGVADPAKPYPLPERESEQGDFELDPFGELEGRGDSSDETQQYQLAVRVAQALARLGYDEQAAELFTRLAKRAGAIVAPPLTEVCQAEHEVELDELARRHATEYGNPETDQALRDALFGDQSAAAARWWHVSTIVEPKMPSGERLDRVWKLTAGTVPKDQRLQIVRQAAEWLVPVVDSNGRRNPSNAAEPGVGPVRPSQSQLLCGSRLAAGVPPHRARATLSTGGRQAVSERDNPHLARRLPRTAIRMARSDATLHPGYREGAGFPVSSVHARARHDKSRKPRGRPAPSR